MPAVDCFGGLLWNGSIDLLSAPYFMPKQKDGKFDYSGTSYNQKMLLPINY